MDAGNSRSFPDVPEKGKNITFEIHGTFNNDVEMKLMNFVVTKDSYYMGEGHILIDQKWAYMAPYKQNVSWTIPANVTSGNYEMTIRPENQLD